MQRGLWVGAGLLLLILVVVFLFNNTSEQNITGELARNLESESLDTSLKATGGNVGECNDSDGGLNYLIKGNTTNASLVFEDYCYQNGQLVEGYCVGDGTVASNFVTCSDGYSCVDGACVQSPSVISCNDSDGGKNPFVRGIQTITYSTGVQDSTIEICAYSTGPTTGEVGDRVIEAWCNGISKNEEIIFCDNGCVAGACTLSQNLSSCGNGIIDLGEVCDGINLGAVTCNALGFDGGTLSCSSSCKLDISGCYEDVCIPNCEGKTCGSDGCGGVCGTCQTGQFCEAGSCKSFTCADSDGGKNYNVAGTVLFNGQNYTDFCNSTRILNEYSCAQSGMMDFNSYACPYGCENTASGGKCKAAPSKPPRVCKTAFCKLTVGGAKKAT